MPKGSYRNKPGVSGRMHGGSHPLESNKMGTSRSGVRQGGHLGGGTQKVKGATEVRIFDSSSGRRSGSMKNQGGY